MVQLDLAVGWQKLVVKRDFAGLGPVEEWQGEVVPGGSREEW
jgi:hypothetical protein